MCTLPDLQDVHQTSVIAVVGSISAATVLVMIQQQQERQTFYHNFGFLHCSELLADATLCKRERTKHNRRNAETEGIMCSYVRKLGVFQGWNMRYKHCGVFVGVAPGIGGNLS